MATITRAKDYDPEQVLKAYARHGSKVRAAKQELDTCPGSSRFNDAWQKILDNEWIRHKSPNSQHYVLTEKGLNKLHEDNIKPSPKVEVVL